MRILLTGAFGNLGTLVLDKLLQQGHQVTAFDIRSKVNLEIAAQYQGRASIHWGDIRDAQGVAQQVRGQDAVIHLAAMIMPFSELNPALAWDINVKGTEHLLEAIAQQEKPPLFVYTSSFAVYGIRQDDPPPRTLDEPVVATDHYSEQKIACESLIRQQAFPWVILRLGAMTDSRMRHSNTLQAKLALELAPDNRVEYIHPADAATAVVNALTRPQAHNRVHLIGGGPSCQVTHLDILNAMTGAMGITFRPGDLGSRKLYADWADTRESQRLLEFQQHSFADYRRENYARFGWLRHLVRPLSPLIVRGMKLYLKAA